MCTLVSPSTDQPRGAAASTVGCTAGPPTSLIDEANTLVGKLEDATADAVEYCETSLLLFSYLLLF